MADAGRPYDGPERRKSPRMSLDDQQRPYSNLSDEQLQAVYERIAHDPDDPNAPSVLAELVARGIANQ